MKEENDILLSRFLAGELPERELREMEQRLNADPEFAEALRGRRQEDTFLRTEADLPDLRAKMKELAEEHFTVSAQTITEQPENESENELDKGRSGGAPEAKVRKLSWWRYAAGGSVAAIMLLAIYWFEPFTAGDPYQQYAQYEPLSLTEKSATLAPTAAPAEAAFNRANYEEAFQLLTSYLKDQPEDNQARLALGIAALETGREQIAQDIFTTLAGGRTSYQDDGQFYLGYALLRSGDPGARAALEKVSPNNPDYGVRVQKMLQLLGD